MANQNSSSKKTHTKLSQFLLQQIESSWNCCCKFYKCIVFLMWIGLELFKKEEKEKRRPPKQISHTSSVRCEVRGSRFESNFMICMKLLESQRRSNIIRRERKVFPAPFSPYFAKKCCFNEVSLVSDVPIRSLILCNCGICEHVQTAIAASSIAVTAGILLPRSEQPVQMRQLRAGGSTDLG